MSFFKNPLGLASNEKKRKFRILCNHFCSCRFHIIIAIIYIRCFLSKDIIVYIECNDVLSLSLSRSLIVVWSEMKHYNLLLIISAFFSLLLLVFYIFSLCLFVTLFSFCCWLSIFVLSVVVHIIYVRI